MEKRIVEAGAGRIGGARAIINGLDVRPVGGGQAHGAGRNWCYSSQPAKLNVPSARAAARMAFTSAWAVDRWRR